MDADDLRNPNPEANGQDQPASNEIESDLTEVRMELRISFPEKSTAEANVLAAELQNEIEMLGEPVEVQRARDRADTLDFGATLILILGAPAAIELAKGIAAWIKRTGTTISLKCGDKDVVVKNVDSSDLPGVMAAVCGGSSTQH